MSTLIGYGGYIPDPADPRDFSFSMLQPKLLTVGVEDEHRIPISTPVSNQGSIQSCVGNATADAFEILAALERGDPVQYSRMLVYWNARAATGDTKHDAGTHLRTAMESGTTFGFCKESTWPYDTSKVFVRPSLEAFAEAHDHRFSGYYRIDTNLVDSVDAAIRANHPVVGGFAIGPEFVNFRYHGGASTIFEPAKTVMGGHAMIVVGVAKMGNYRKFLLRNSWGEGWGEGGYVWVVEEFIRDAMDLWVGTKAPPE